MTSSTDMQPLLDALRKSKQYPRYITPEKLAHVERAWEREAGKHVYVRKHSDGRRTKMARSMNDAVKVLAKGSYDIESADDESDDEDANEASAEEAEKKTVEGDKPAAAAGADKEPDALKSPQKVKKPKASEEKTDEGPGSSTPRDDDKPAAAAAADEEPEALTLPKKVKKTKASDKRVKSDGASHDKGKAPEEAVKGKAPLNVKRKAKAVVSKEEKKPKEKKPKEKKAYKLPKGLTDNVREGDVLNWYMITESWPQKAKLMAAFTVLAERSADGIFTSEAWKKGKEGNHGDQALHILIRSRNGGTVNELQGGPKPKNKGHYTKFIEHLDDKDEPVSYEGKSKAVGTGRYRLTALGKEYFKNGDAAAEDGEDEESDNDKDEEAAAHSDSDKNDEGFMSTCSSSEEDE